MKSFVLMVGALVMSALVQAADLKVSVGDKDIAIQYRVLNREITEKNRNTGSQGSAEECSYLYYSLLARDDIAGAAQLDVNPAAAVKLWTGYRDRLGGDDFRKETAAYFKAKNVIVAALELADETMLVIKSPENTGGQFFRKKDGKYYLVSGLPLSETSKALGKALRMIQEGKIKLQ